MFPKHKLNLATLAFVTTQSVDQAHLKALHSRRVNGIAPHFYEADGVPHALTLVEDLDDIVPARFRDRVGHRP